jgi:hypothetical protein
MRKKTRLGTLMQGKLIRDPNNPFAAWDEEGRPFLPMAIDDDSPSKGTSGGPFGIFNHDGSRAVPAARRLARHPSCSSATSRKLMVYRFNWS